MEREEECFAHGHTKNPLTELMDWVSKAYAECKAVINATDERVPFVNLLPSFPPSLTQKDKGIRT